jgi:hypothetical protein
MKVEVTDLDPVLTEKFVTFCCEEMDIDPGLVYVEGWDTPLFNKATGLCYEVEHLEEYLIHVYTKDRNLTEIYNTLAHEMIHVKQFMKQDLGNVVTQHKPIYTERWWEKEASVNSLQLVKKYVDILYEMV